MAGRGSRLNRRIAFAELLNLLETMALGGHVFTAFGLLIVDMSENAGVQSYVADERWESSARHDLWLENW